MSGGSSRSLERKRSNRTLIFVGIDRGDAEAVADGGVGGRAAALAKDAHLARLLDDLVHGQEVGRDLLALDQVELVPDGLGDFFGNAVGIAPGRALPGQALELLHRRLAALVLDGILVAELIEREVAAVDDLLRCARSRADAGGTAAPSPCRLLEMPLGAGEAAEAQPLDGAVEADGRDHVVQRPPLGHVIVHVVGGDQADPHRGGEIVEQRQAARIVAAEQHGAGEVAAVAEQAGERAQPLVEGRVLDPARRQDDGQNVLGMGREVLEGEVALALRRPAIADRQQARQPLVALEVHRIGEQRIAVAGLEPGADQQLEPLFPGMPVSS